MLLDTIFPRLGIYGFQCIYSILGSMSRCILDKAQWSDKYSKGEDYAALYQKNAWARSIIFPITEQGYG